MRLAGRTVARGTAHGIVGVWGRGGGWTQRPAATGLRVKVDLDPEGEPNPKKKTGAGEDRRARSQAVQVRRADLRLRLDAVAVEFRPQVIFRARVGTASQTTTPPHQTTRFGEGVTRAGGAAALTEQCEIPAGHVPTDKNHKQVPRGRGRLANEADAQWSSTSDTPTKAPPNHRPPTSLTVQPRRTKAQRSMHDRKPEEQALQAGTCWLFQWEGVVLLCGPSFLPLDDRTLYKAQNCYDAHRRSLVRYIDLD